MHLLPQLALRLLRGELGGQRGGRRERQARCLWVQRPRLSQACTKAVFESIRLQSPFSRSRALTTPVSLRTLKERLLLPLTSEERREWLLT